MMDWHNAPRAALDNMPLKPQWVVVERNVLASLLDIAVEAGYYSAPGDSAYGDRLRQLRADIEQGRCTLLTQARWKGADK